MTLERQNGVIRAIATVCTYVALAVTLGSEAAGFGVIMLWIGILVEAFIEGSS